LTKGWKEEERRGGGGEAEVEGLFEATALNEVDAERDRATLEVVVECGGSGVGRWRRVWCRM
jgi:hypothetical protein